MCIVIIGAMTIEVTAIKELITLKKVDKISEMNFHIGEYKNNEVICVVCGVGKVQAAMCAQTAILTYKPDIVINLGVAGGIGQGIHTTDIVVADKIVQHDFDLTAIGEGKGIFSDVDLKISQKFMKIASEKLKDIKTYQGMIATGDQFISDDTVRQSLINDYNSLACEMEGAAIARVCEQNGVKCAVVRAISDNADNEAIMAFEQFLEQAVKNSVVLMEAFLSNI